MAGLADFQLPPPAKWEDFEDLCLDLWRKIWRDENAQKNGRRGQPQEGVDIFGRPGGGPHWAGVQCKGKNEARNSALSVKELLAEVEKAKTFKPQLSTFTVACTGPRNAALQERARLLTQVHEQQGLFSVSVWYWDDILERLNDFPEVTSLHFPHFHPVQTFSAFHRNNTSDAETSKNASPSDPSVFLAFAQPSTGARMLQKGIVGSQLGKPPRRRMLGVSQRSVWIRKINALESTQIGERCVDRL